MEFDLKAMRTALDQLELERGIPRAAIIETLELALAAAYKKDYGKRGQIVRATFSEQTGEVNFVQIKIVVNESMIKTEEEIAQEAEEREEAAHVVQPHGAGAEKNLEDKDEPETGEEATRRKVRFNPERHIMITEARKIKKDVSPGEELVFPLETRKDYGRIAAQTAKQVIIQRIREAERSSVFKEFTDKEGTIVSGIVQRIEERTVFLDLGRATALLPAEEQVRGERYRMGERIKALLYLVEQTPRGINLHISRSHPRFVSELFKLEVPEIANGVVEIKSIAREPGSRTKVAVASHDENIDPVGSSVGQKGVRVSTVIAELGGEKIDIIEWAEDPATFIAHALAPARILDVDLDKEQKVAHVIVAEDQLSLAIGRGGQNVRLAARLVNWKIDIRSRGGQTGLLAPESETVSEEQDGEERAEKKQKETGKEEGGQTETTRTDDTEKITEEKDAADDA
ncbi:MAG: transcription termination/antitermination protein NusA [Parcubacteria group bacterium]|nr:transcription termination/antitermination protein NusA [Parcubacteria group bacterium]MBI2175128.1 transcription termination/antitermination protein NusA [Parcubacteria group bacterium]